VVDSPGAKSLLDEELVRRLLADLETTVGKLRELAGVTPEEMRKATEKAWAVQRGLQIAIQNVLDIGITFLRQLASMTSRTTAASLTIWVPAESCQRSSAAGYGRWRAFATFWSMDTRAWMRTGWRRSYGITWTTSRRSVVMCCDTSNAGPADLPVEFCFDARESA
jgi:hypothetical protein